MKCFEEVLFNDGVWRHCYIPHEMKQKFARDRLAAPDEPLGLMKTKLTDEK